MPSLSSYDTHPKTRVRSVASSNFPNRQTHCALGRPHCSHSSLHRLPGPPDSPPTGWGPATQRPAVGLVRAALLVRFLLQLLQCPEICNLYHRSHCSHMVPAGQDFPERTALKLPESSLGKLSCGRTQGPPFQTSPQPTPPLLSLCTYSPSHPPHCLQTTFLSSQHYYEVDINLIVLVRKQFQKVCKLPKNMQLFHTPPDMTIKTDA